MKIFLRSSFTFLFLLPILCFAQNQTKGCANYQTATALPKVIDDNKNVVEPYDGTYQFIFTKGVKQVFTDEIISVINKNRKEKEEVTLVLSEYCQLHILSKKQISSKEFSPLQRARANS